ncbi:MAG: DNA photolyase family protein [Bacteroidetes bacterium]|jgi:deoxyribodipyrimidine photo-lyase|nr:DNA photolyase family protein [Bacteroidota bacterium]
MIYFWHRRDLRIADNAGLYHALRAAKESGRQVQPVFIFDTDILDALPRRDARVLFIHQALASLAAQYRALGCSLWLGHGKPEEVWRQWLHPGGPPPLIYTNEDYEPYARRRDQQIHRLAGQQGGALRLVKDQVLLHKDEVLSKTGNRPYTVFTPYSRQWRAVLTPFHLKAYPTERYTAYLAPGTTAAWPLPSLQTLGFEFFSFPFPPASVPDVCLSQYKALRDLPAAAGTSRLGVHLRFGTLSIRALARQAQGLSDTFVNELIWRDFYAMILYHYPQVVHSSFRPAYDAIPWREDEADYDRWCAGTTGYPLVDAGMRQLNETGYMHNRVRMLVASFLCKHLLIDWRRGEHYFAQKLLDYDLASNNGGWQWAAGTGCDAAPYFRIFNPDAQLQKFDPQAEYVRRWLPEWGTTRYPKPMVVHAQARQRALEVYKKALNRKPL